MKKAGFLLVLLGTLVLVAPASVRVAPWMDGGRSTRTPAQPHTISSGNHDDGTLTRRRNGRADTLDRR